MNASSHETVSARWPDPGRVGGPDWLARTGGAMSREDCLRGAIVAAVQLFRVVGERLLPFLAGNADLSSMPRVPDSRLVRLAEEAALEQDEVMRMHGFRTSIFGRALAHGDGVNADPELLHVCGLLHDVGLLRAVTGEDFTLRSGAAARRVADAAGQPPVVGRALEDALNVHTTAGVRADRDGALGAYTQFGAMVDLTGLRLAVLPRELVREVLARHPRGPFKQELLRRFDAEVRAMPRGRFAFARCAGFRLAVRAAPFAS